MMGNHICVGVVRIGHVVVAFTLNWLDLVVMTKYKLALPNLLAGQLEVEERGWQ